jgi:hypothetical protein
MTTPSCEVFRASLGDARPVMRYHASNDGHLPDCVGLKAVDRHCLQCNHVIVDGDECMRRAVSNESSSRAAGTGTQARGFAEEVRGWFTGRLPDEWFTGTAEVVVDREEITIVGTLPAPGASGGESASGESASDEAHSADPGEAEAADDTDSGGESSAAGIAAAEGRVKRFREDTRARRIEIAREAERRFGRKVAWGVRCGDVSEMFTTLSVPVMTRLRQSERRVLDTLVDAGVARSRSDALAWCVRLTGEHADAWLTELRDALLRVEEVRAQGPTVA